MRGKSLPNIEDCIKGRVYKLRCRNLSIGVWNGRNGFIGVRTKFYDRYLFTEYHYDTGMHGTVMDAQDMGIDAPNHILLKESLGSIDSNTGRPVAFDKPVADGGRGWYYTDTNEEDQNIRAMSRFNKELFDFLDSLQNVQADT